MMGVAADDLTGATDIGAMFSAAGFETMAFTGTDAARAYLQEHPGPEVAIIDTASRYEAPGTAYARVAEAVAVLRDAGATRFFKKTCSVFRGNVGSEFDAMLDTLGEDFAVIVPGYPSNRRVTRYGVMYAAGVPLSESHFSRDPFHPTHRSNLVEVLRGETQRHVCLVDRDTVRAGAPVARQAMERKRAACAYLVFDVADAAALRVVAEAARDERLFGGSAGLAAALAPLWKPEAPPASLPPLPARPTLGVPVVSGSLTPVTARQVAAFRERGADVVAIRTADLLDLGARERETARAAEAASDAVRSGRNVAVVSPADTASVSAVEAGRRISAALGDIAARVLDATGQDRLLVAGGDTAAAVCDRLEARALRIGDLVEPGIPFCDALGTCRVRLLLKGGSMGADDVLLRAAERLGGAA